MHSSSRTTILRSPTFWSGVLAGCVLAVLTLASVGVYAQVAGDVPGSGASADVPVAGITSSLQIDETAGDIPGSAPASAPDSQIDETAGDQPGSVPVENSSAASPPAALGEDAGGMFTDAGNAPLGTTAAISSTITYQGVLKDGDSPADGSYDFRFRLFDDPDAGTQVGEQFAEAVSVQDGQFTAALDFGSLAFYSQAVWLEVAVRPAGGGAYETLAPRQALTPAPLALSLPNVSTDPASGYVGVGSEAPISSFQTFGINQDYDGWVGMYITGGGDSARPYYGYATDDEGSFDYAWTEYNGTSDEWQLYITELNVFSVDDVGDVSQPAGANGLVKAAAYVECWPDPGIVTVYSFFNNVNDAPVTAAAGPNQGGCYIDFGFDLTGRFFNATAVFSGDHRAVTCAVDPGDSNRLHCTRWRANDAGSEGWAGQIMVTIY